MADPYDLVVIGGGPAGYTAALRVADLGGRAALVEEQAAGGNCVQHNCIPTMIMLDTLEGAGRAQALAVAGIVASEGLPAFNRAVARKQQLVAAMSAGIRSQLRTKKVEFLPGRARIARPGLVEASLTDGTSTTLECRNILVATGARPELPDIPGLNANDILTADAALRLTVPPASALVIGGGPIGLVFALELAQLFAGFGSRVTLVQEADSILPDEERQLALILQEALKAAGVETLTGTSVVRVEPGGGGQVAVLRGPDGARAVPTACVVAPDRRRPYWADLGLEALRPEQERGALVVDERGETSVPHIYAAGDVTGGAMYSHRAALAGRVVGENALGRETARDDRWLPRAIYTDPEYAAVGSTEAQAKAAGRTVRTGTANFLTNARAITMGQREGVIKLVADAASGQILGVHILGPGAGELIGQAVLAMRLEATVDDLAAVTHWHPTLAESLTEAARRAVG